MIAKIKIALLSGTLGLALASAVQVKGQEQAPAPVRKPGQSWQFSVKEVLKGISRSDAFNGIYELRVVGEKIAVAQLIDGKREPITARSSVLRELIGVAPEDRADFKFPLSAGQKWNYSYEARLVGSSKATRRQVEVNVTGPEQVTTAAGSFKAFKITKEDGGGGTPGQVTWVTIHYWSPETNSVVKSSFDSTGGTGVGTIREAELVKFGAKQ